MATTTNYGWTTPDDTALVKDGASAIRTLGSSVDTTTKNLNPETTLGDLSFRSSTSNVNTRIPIGSSGQHLTVVAGVPAWATASDQTPLTTKGDLFTFSTLDARLPVGTNTHVLTADSAEATGLKWAAPAVSASGLTLISAVSFGNVASQDFLSVFTSTYNNYLIVLSGIQRINAAGASTLGISFFTGTNTAYTGGILGGVLRISHTGAAVTGYGSYANSLATISRLEEDGQGRVAGLIQLSRGSGGLTATSNLKSQNNPNDQTNMGTYVGGFNSSNTTSITGFKLLPASGNFDGEARIYGLANS